jgi:hypothetical protein
MQGTPFAGRGKRERLLDKVSGDWKSCTRRKETDCLRENLQGMSCCDVLIMEVLRYMLFVMRSFEEVGNLSRGCFKGKFRYLEGRRVSLLAGCSRLPLVGLSWDWVLREREREEIVHLSKLIYGHSWWVGTTHDEARWHVL